MSDALAPLPEKSSPRKHRKNLSSLSELSFVELDRNEENNHVELVVNDNPDESTVIPLSTLIIVSETEKLHGDHKRSESVVLHDVLADEYDFTLEEGKFKVRDWDGTKGYSDYIAQGLKYKKVENPNVVMLYESPSSSSADFTFHNKTKFKFHDWPPPAKVTSG